MFLKEEAETIEEQAVVEALSNEHDRQVLALAQGEPVQAPELLEKTGIPKSTLYRRIRELKDEGLLRVVGARIQNGHRIDRYQCPLDEVTLSVTEGSVEVDWE